MKILPVKVRASTASGLKAKSDTIQPSATVGIESVQKALDRDDACFFLKIASIKN